MYQKNSFIIDFRHLCERLSIGKQSFSRFRMWLEPSGLESDVEVSCLPRYLPEYLEVDMAELDVGDTVHLSQIPLPEGVVIVALTHGEEYDAAVASVHMPRVTEEEEPAEEEEGAEAAEGEEAGEESGEESSEGEGGDEASEEGGKE